MTEREKRIIAIARYIIKNKETIKNAAEHFNISVSSVKKYINDENNLQKISVDDYNMVKQTQKEISHIANIKGGKTGKRSASLTEKEALIIAKDIIANNLTYTEASIKYNIPRTTIYERVHAIKSIDLNIILDKVAIENKGGRAV